MSSKSLGLSFLAGLLLILGLPPLKLHVLSWLAWIPLFWLFEEHRPRKFPFFIFTIILGTLYFGVLLFWVVQYEFFIYLLLVFLSLFFFAIYFSLLYFLAPQAASPVQKIITAISLWLLLLKAYAFSPIGSAFFEVPFYAPLAFLRVTSITGFAGLSVLILAIMYALVLGCGQKAAAPLWLAVFIASILGGMILWQRHPEPDRSPDPVAIKAALIQHNLPYSVPWRIRNYARIGETYRKLAVAAVRRDVDLLIFPLYTLPDDFQAHLEGYLALAREIGKPVLLASHMWSEEKDDPERVRYWNRALLLGPEGTILDSYDAVQAPFFITLERTASKPKILSVGPMKFGVLLCSEDGRPRLVRKAVRKGAEFLIALSNPGQFQSPNLAYFHLMQDRLRAMESGRFLARVSANGPSVLVTPEGRILAQASVGEEKILYVEIPARRGLTFFYRWGFLWDSLAVFYLLIFAGVHYSRKPRVVTPSPSS